jgi:hypothetical protein
MAKLSRQHKHSKRSGSKSKSKRKSSAWMDLEEAPPLRIMPDDPDEDDDAPPPKRSASSTTMVPTTYTEERVLEIQVYTPLMPLPRRH